MIAALLIAAATSISLGQSGSIAYLAGDSPAALQVSVVDTETGQTRAIGAGQGDGPPVPSPDGAWIAYTSNDGDRRVVRIVQPDGSDGRVLPHSGTWHDQPAWTPFGKAKTLLAYTVGKAYGEKRIAVYDLRADKETLWGGEEGVGVLRPVFLPERTISYIAAAATEKLDFDFGKIQAEVMASGTNLILTARALPEEPGMSLDIGLVTPKQLLPPLFDTILPHQGVYEEWNAVPSPDGRVVAFESNDGGDREIYLLSFRRSVYNLSNHYESDWNPVWGPESDYVLFESFRSGRRGIYRVYIDTVRVSPIAVSDDADHWSPACGPDGSRIALVSDRDGTPDLFIANSDGSEMRALAATDGLELSPVWIPEGGE